ncbi:MAG: DUF262 domain-containing protein [Saprospiraceae bacterium]|nr:DUF262 domain-containing protein [Saprospiraceae bacterium]
MAVGNFSTANQTYRMLMGNGLIYSVPRFQRDYSWTDEEWDDLWNDIENVLSPEGEPSHYMGYLVLQSQDSKYFDIIDGQQRLTTLSIIVLAVLSNIQRLIESGEDAENNRRRQDQLRNSLIGYLDPVTLIARSKLNLNRNNDNLYQNYLVPLQPAPKRNLKSTEHQMRKAFEWWQEKTAHIYRSGEALAGFIDRLTDKLFFTVITVSDELNAYKVFETLNARGVKLSSTDLLKNYLFSVVHDQNQDEHELSNLETRWEELVGKLGSESFPDFLRAHWNSRNKFLRHSELFKRIRDRIRNREEVFALLRDMMTDVDTYVALSKPEDELWTPEQRKYIGELRMFNVRQVYPLLLTACRKFTNPKELRDILRAISIISFRYNVISNNPANEQERVYNTVAERLATENMTFRDVLNELRPIYIRDKDFIYAFSNKILKTTQSRNKRVVRYILFAIEQHITTISHDFDSDRYNLEHIMPENLSEAWDHITDMDHEQFVYRLGNMTIMSTAQNRNLGNAGFDVKRETFLNSEFQLTQRVAAENAEWNPSRIEHHQSWMATQATAIWRVAQLS